MLVKESIMLKDRLKAGDEYEMGIVSALRK